MRSLSLVWRHVLKGKEVKINPLEELPVRRVVASSSSQSYSIVCFARVTRLDYEGAIVKPNDEY